MLDSLTIFYNVVQNQRVWVNDRVLWYMTKKGDKNESINASYTVFYCSNIDWM